MQTETIEEFIARMRAKESELLAKMDALKVQIRSSLASPESSQRIVFEGCLRPEFRFTHF